MRIVALAYPCRTAMGVGRAFDKWRLAHWSFGVRQGHNTKMSV